MNKLSDQIIKKQPVGDTAVDGLMAGLAAGAGMMLFLVLAGLLAGNQPVTTMGYFDPAQTGDWSAGLLAHFAVSVIYGLLFALLLRLAGTIWPVFYRLRWLFGLGYGLLLLLLAQGLLLTSAASWLSQMAGWSLALAHIVYGLLLARQIGRKR